ncbi:MFS transporter [Streptomyces sp. NPDC026665]|uniref:MFS transporter n=1 Tax=Streptomyces sp. NPDC026665 TaxID=3154798 RepID=UPI0033C871F8
MATTTAAETRLKEPMKGFHYRITATTFGANFSDGYALGIIGAVLPALTVSMNLSGWWQGLLGASALIGLFFGSIVLGWVGDLVGRQKLYIYNFALIAVASLLQLWADDPLTLFGLRLLIGFGLGADYAVGPTLLSEFAPRRVRGLLLGSLTVLWTVGYVVANVLGTYLSLDDFSSHLLLASSALPAALVLVLRIGTPESPGWLVSRGRIEEARAITRKFLGTELDIPEPTAATAATEKKAPGYGQLFARGQRRNTWFGVLFYSAQVLPYFAIYTFMGTILTAMRVSDADTQNLVLNLFLLLGGVVGLWPTQRMGRRPFTIISFGILTACLAALALLANASPAAMMIPFVVYTFVMSGASNITQVYPPELYPTALRASGVGFLNGASRVASALGTFVLPLSLDHLGVSWSMAWLAGVLLLGMIVSIAWAPETKNSVTTEGWHH